jgi:BirA family transcriptional regulator, biotin operon repressor / biotin---[acetyl-CoA-carboxylase] ligase
LTAVGEALREGLRARGRDWAAPIEHHTRLGSTSDRLKERARDGAPEWTVVLAHEQTGGRGRQGRLWASPPGGLYLSVLLRPRVEAAGLIPLAAGVAVVEALREWGVAAELKWPNDALAGGRKLAGILAEASSSASGVDWVVLGLGVNLEAGEGLPAGIRETATSISTLTGARVEPTDMSCSFLAHLAFWYDALRSEPAAVVRAWNERALPWWGRHVELRSGGQVMRGIAEGIDSGGALVLRREDGSRTAVLSGDVTAIRLES